MYFEIYRGNSGHCPWRARKARQSCNHRGQCRRLRVNKADCLHGINIIKNEAAMAQVIEI